jgi:hypothetical protein
MKPVSYLPIRTLCKFYENHEEHRSERNRLISKSLLKLVMLDQTWLDSGPKHVPADGEWWIVDLVHETRPGEGRGCFLSHPIRPVRYEDTTRLLPGMFKETWHAGTGRTALLVLEPLTGGVCWLLPQRHRNQIRGVHAVLVRQ